MIGWHVNDDEQTRKNIHALSRIWTHSLSTQAIKAYYASECTATKTINHFYPTFIPTGKM
jgi:hypothetical protein